MVSELEITTEQNRIYNIVNSVFCEYIENNNKFDQDSILYLESYMRYISKNELFNLIDEFCESTNSSNGTDLYLNLKNLKLSNKYKKQLFIKVENLFLKNYYEIMNCEMLSKEQYMINFYNDLLNRNNNKVDFLVKEVSKQTFHETLMFIIYNYINNDNILLKPSKHYYIDNNLDLSNKTNIKIKSIDCVSQDKKIFGSMKYCKASGGSQTNNMKDLCDSIEYYNDIHNCKFIAVYLGNESVRHMNKFLENFKISENVIVYDLTKKLNDILIYKNKNE